MYLERMLMQIVGLEIPLTRIMGKWKMSQNRPSGDRLGVAAGLSAQDSDAARAVQELVSTYHETQTRR